MPEGYFVGASLNISLTSILSIVLPLLFVLITYLLWNKFGKGKQVIETVEFYPPQGFNSAEVGFLYKGKVENEDVISLLIYLANKGYIISTISSSLIPIVTSFKEGLVIVLYCIIDDSPLVSGSSFDVKKRIA